MIGKRKLCRVCGKSMEPLLKEGDYVIYKSLTTSEKSLKEGNIVVAEHPLEKNKLIIKRVLNIDSTGVFLIGDNKLSSTDSRHYGRVNFSKVIGLAEELSK